MTIANPKRSLGVLALLLVAIWLLVRALHPRPLDSVALPGYGLGQALAETAAVVINDKGKLLVVYSPADTVEVQSQWEGFEKTLKKHRGIRIIKVYNLKTDNTGYVACNQFLDMIKEQAQADLIVSFLPVAPFPQAQLGELPSPSPKLVVMGLTHEDGNGDRLGAMGVKAMIRPRIPSDFPSEKVKTAKDWFNYYYEIKTF